LTYQVALSKSSSLSFLTHGAVVRKKSNHLVPSTSPLRWTEDISSS